jgi:hypothetical protein
MILSDSRTRKALASLGSGLITDVRDPAAATATSTMSTTKPCISDQRMPSEYPVKRKASSEIRREGVKLHPSEYRRNHERLLHASKAL